MSDTPTPITEPISHEIGSSGARGLFGGNRTVNEREYTNPPEGKRGHGSGPDGEYTVDDLKRDLPISAGLRRMAGGEALSAKDALELLKTRFDADSDLKDRGLDASLNMVLAAIGEDLWTAAALDRLDLRPFLKLLDGRKIRMATVLVANKTGVHLAPNALGSALDEVGLANHLTHEEERVTTAFGQIQSGTDLPEDRRQAKLDQVTKYSDSAAGVLRAMDESTAQFLTGGSDFLPESSTPKGRWSADDMLKTMNLNLAEFDSNTWNDFVNQEAAMQQANGGGYFPVQIDTGTPVRSSRPGTVEGAVTKGAVTLSALEATRYLQTLSDTEVKKIQVKLAAAGYFDQTTKGSAYIPGNGFDPITDEAWRLALAESASKNQPLTQTIGERISGYRKQVREQRIGQLSELDPSYTRVLADEWAQSAIGRRLLPEEQDALHLQLRMLVSKRAGYVAGADDNTADMAPVGEMGVDEVDISLALEDKYHTEQLSTSWAESLKALH